ncbi:MAG: hypothetical protein JXJ04_26615 [Spirochaetales bacterium]|nr:hypothetical protein [Spirochaetales bacterium]
MKKKNCITPLTLSEIDKTTTGNTAYAKLIREEILQIKKIGLSNLSVDYVRALEKRLTNGQIGYLLAHDNDEFYYTDMCKNLKLDKSRDFDPHELIFSLSYPVGNLIGNNFNAMTVKGLEGGRIFESSGTTNPKGRKKIYYDAVSCLFIREIHVFCWQSITGVKLSKKDHHLFLAPPEAVYGMPFAAFVADYLEANESHVHFGAQFISPPKIYLDKDYNVLAAQLNFQNNVIPDKSAVIKFNISSKLSGGKHSVSGLLPTIVGMVSNTLNFKGIKSFFATVKPHYYIYGGGLKKRGIPPEVQQKGIDAVSVFLKEISNITSFNHEFLIKLYKSSDEKDQQKLDDILFINANRILESNGGKPINVYAAADMTPAMYSIGSLSELYGEDYYKAGSDNHIHKDIYFYPPGVIVELFDPSTGELIPRERVNTPGIMTIWNPYNLSHLQAPQTEDIMQWVDIPSTSPINPPYLQNKGLQFVSRVRNAKGQGVC